MWIIKSTFLLLVSSLLVACATPKAPQVTEGRNPAQRSALKSLGFVENNDGWDLNLAGKILFRTDDAVLSEEGQNTVKKIAETLIGVGIDTMRVEGHTDNTGSAEYNKRLSESRAKSVATNLSAHGFQLSKIDLRGLGSTVPIASNDNEEGRTNNRRAVLIVYGK